MKYARLLSRLYNQPLALSQAKLDVLTSQVTLRLLTGEDVPTLSADISITKSVSAPEKPTIGLIRVFDSLVSKNGIGDSGSTSYESINNQIQSAISAGIDTLVFYIDSPGGEVSGLFGLAKTIKSLPDLGIKTVAISDGMMTSAAYVIGAACNEVYATSSTIVGSVGVIMTLINTTAADKKSGISYKIIRSKDEKALLNPHEPFSDTGINDAIKMLGTLDTIMNETVSSCRPNLTTEKLISLNGNTVLGEEALSLGLIDGVVETYSEVIDSLTVTTLPSNHSTKQPNGANMSLTTEEALTENISLKSELEAAKNNLTLAVAKGKLDEQARILGVLEAAETFKLNTAVAIKRIKAGTSVDDTVEMFESIKEAIQASNPLPISGTEPSGTGFVDIAGVSEIDRLIEAASKVGKTGGKDDFSATQDLLNLVR